MFRKTAMILAVLFVLANAPMARADQKIQIKLSANGLDSLKYKGVEYVDPSGAGALGFTSDPDSDSNKAAATGVSDASKSRAPFSPIPTSVKVEDSMVVKIYPWGTLSTQYQVKDADVYITATITNTSPTPIDAWNANLMQFNTRLVFDRHPGDYVMPFGYSPNMHWDYSWAMWGGASDGYKNWNFADPHVYWWVDKAAPFETAQVKVMFADLDPRWNTGVAHVKTAHGDAWPVIVASDASSSPALPLATGKSDSTHIVIRFRDKAPDDPAIVEKTKAKVKAIEKKVAAAQAKLKELQQEVDAGLGDADAVKNAQGVVDAASAELAKAKTEQATEGIGAMPSAIDVCADAYDAFGRAYPRTARWTDRRPIGSYFAGRGTIRTEKNPNGWFNDAKIDVTTPQGRSAFAAKLLADIDNTIVTLKETGAQGVIWWDVEGERWPQPTTYIGDPRVLDPGHPDHDKYAPELDTQVTYNGRQMPVIDACFKKWADAGLRTGLTIRPQSLAFINGAAAQPTHANQVADNLCDKATYARDRFGCTMFYVDSINEWFGSFWMEKVIKKYPDILLVPEWGRTRSYRHSSQFSYTRFTGFYRGVPAEMQACWPDAFCCMANVDLDKGYNDAVFAVKNGNLLLFNCWYGSAETQKIKQIYETTGVRHTPVAHDDHAAASGKPLNITLHATDEDGDKITFAILGQPAHGELSQFDPSSGTVTYTPTPGYVGSDAFSFTAIDATGLKSNRAVIELAVGK